MRLVADHELLAVTGTHDVTHVVMPMRRYALVLGDPVPVEVEQFPIDHQPSQAGFFPGFLQRRTRQVAITVGVPAAMYFIAAS